MFKFLLALLTIPLLLSSLLFLLLVTFISTVRSKAKGQKLEIGLEEDGFADCIAF